MGVPGPQQHGEPLSADPGEWGRGGNWAAAAGGQAARNLVSTFCYLSLEWEARDLVHGGRQALLGGAAQAAERHGGHHQDKEHKAHAVAEDACVHAARLARRHQLLLGCKDMDIGAWPSCRRDPTVPRPPGAMGTVGVGEGCSTSVGVLRPTPHLVRVLWSEMPKRRSPAEPAAPAPATQRDAKAATQTGGPSWEWGLNRGPLGQADFDPIPGTGLAWSRATVSLRVPLAALACPKPATRGQVQSKRQQEPVPGSTTSHAE